MSVERRQTPAGVRWVVRWREEGRRRAKHFDRYTDARTFDAAKRTEIRDRRQLGDFAAAPASEMPLDEFMAKAWDERAIGWEQNTRDARAEIMDTWISPLLGHVPLRECAKPRIRQFRTQMIEEGVPRRDGKRGRHKATPNRVNSVIHVLSAFLGFAVDDGLIPENPCLGLRKLPHRATKHRAWDPIVLERIRAQMDPRDAIAVSLMYLAGLRPQEVLGLSWRQVGERTILIDQAAAKGRLKQTKTGTAKGVEICAPLAEDLAAYRELYVARHGAIEPDDLVVPSQRRGRAPMHLEAWRKNIWHPARLAAEVATATPYDCRHTYGSLLIHEGRDVLEVARLMRHATATTTLDHYAHEFDEWKDRAKRTLVEVVRAARAELAGAPLPEASIPSGTQKDHSGAPRGAPGGTAKPLPEGESGLHHPAAHAHAAHDCCSDPGCTGMHEFPGDSGSGEEADEPPIAPPQGARGPKKDPALGRCWDCWRPLSRGLDGTFCEPCEIECPSCGEPECRATCQAELDATAERVARHQRRIAVDLRRATENRRQVERAVWLLAGARP